jgi:hypothetical protein
VLGSPRCCGEGARKGARSALFSPHDHARVFQRSLWRGIGGTAMVVGRASPSRAALCHWGGGPGAPIPAPGPEGLGAPEGALPFGSGGGCSRPGTPSPARPPPVVLGGGVAAAARGPGPPPPRVVQAPRWGTRAHGTHGHPAHWGTVAWGWEVREPLRAAPPSSSPWAPPARGPVRPPWRPWARRPPSSGPLHGPGRPASRRLPPSSPAL